MTQPQSTPARAELAAFLRSRRERLQPSEVGLPATARRRTPGLRREEVCHLAGVGLAWYTWLEQAREIEVSAHFLDRIARALKLDPTERDHLFTLAHNRPPPIVPAPSLMVTPHLRRMLDAITGPAYLATASTRVIAWNAALSAVFGDLAVLPPEDRNMLWLVFASPAHRAAIPQWETDARAMLARFRVEFGRHRDDADFLALIERLHVASPEFRAWWPDHDVSMRTDRGKRFEVRGIGRMELEQSSFMVEESLDMRLVVYTPVDAQSAQKVKLLQRRWSARLTA
jgi:transcriptional regulator with XRE-family HTH domain